MSRSANFRRLSGGSAPTGSSRLPGVIVLVAAALRLPGLERVPPPLCQDEASRGYDAWCLLETGADRHGARWPFFLESFGQGDYTAALSTYLTIPFVAVLGPTPLAMRLPDALFGVLTVVVLHAWLRRQFGETVALVAAAMLAVDPWHIALTRTAHESGFAPFFLSSGLFCLQRAGLLGGQSMDRPRGVWAFLAGFGFSLHAWLYPATRLFTPLFLVALVVLRRADYTVLLRTSAASRRLTAVFLGLLAGGVPLMRTAIVQPHHLSARARAALLDWSIAALPATLPAFLSNYASNLSPGYLFLQCDEMSGARIPGVGLHLPVMAPLMLIGLVLVIRDARRQPFARILLAWLVLYPLPAAICGDWNPHVMRGVAGVPLFPILAGLGGEWLVRRLAGGAPARRRILACCAAAALLVNVAYFADRYFRIFPSFSEPAYQTPLMRAIVEAAKHADSADFILVTNRANQAYIYVLLGEPIPPDRLRTTPMVIAPGIVGFHHVVRLGKYYFAAPDSAEARRLFQREWNAVPRPAEGLVVERAGLWPGGEVLATIQGGDGSDPTENFEVRRWRLE